MIQLSVAPMEPKPPPPSLAKFVSIGASVRPLATHHAAPRQTRSAPRVTMKAGMPKKAMMKPWRPPISAPSAMPKTTTTIQVSGQS